MGAGLGASWRQRTEADLRRAGYGLEAMEADDSLRAPQNLEARSRALDELSFLQELFRARGLGLDEPLLTRVRALQCELAEIDQQLYARIRHRIRCGGYGSSQLRSELERYAGERKPSDGGLITGYSGLDVLVHGLFLFRPTPAESVTRTREMVQYEATPARAVMAMIDEAEIGPKDVFYDLGSGLGHVVLLVRLLAGSQAIGIELDPAFCAYARQSAAELGLSGVRFVAGDARQADLGQGTVFFMFTPFRGTILRSVLARLREQSLRRRIRVCTYGTCTHEVAHESWLQVHDRAMLHDFRLAVFRSLLSPSSDDQRG